MDARRDSLRVAVPRGGAQPTQPAVPSSARENRILCPSCEREGTRVALAIPSSDVQVRCPRCRRRVRVLTRHLAGDMRRRTLSADEARYQFPTYEDGVVVMRELVGPPGLAFHPGDTLSFVSSQGAIIGLAHQESGRYWHILGSQFSLRLRFIALIGLLAALLSALPLLSEWGGQLRDSFDAHPFLTLALGGLVLLCLLGPTLADMVAENRAAARKGA